jgi:hypothetical protein
VSELVWVCADIFVAREVCVSGREREKYVYLK